MDLTVDTSILETYELRPPLPGNALDIFAGQWTCRIPGYGGGEGAHFEDHRIIWLEGRSGGFTGKRVLELGPMDGAHTYMLATRGADVVSIEASRRAYLRCLVVKELLGFKARYLLGDFKAYLDQAPRFDLIVASGVLYHMQDPLGLLQQLAHACDQMFIWTLYYDAEAVAANPVPLSHLSAPVRREQRLDRSFEYWPYDYNEALIRTDFSGGSSSMVHWMTKPGIIEALDVLGFDVEVFQDHPTFVNGPAMSLYAWRRR